MISGRDILNQPEPKVERHYVALPLERLASRLEGVLSRYPHWDKQEEPGVEVRYHLFHDVSASAVWDCGYIVIAHLKETPARVRTIVGGQALGAEALLNWTELTVVTPETMTRDERDQQKIVVNDFLSTLPPIPQVSDEPLGEETWKLLIGSQVASRSVEVVPGSSMALVGQGEPPKPDRKQKRGRPRLSEGDLEARRDVLSKAEQLRKDHPLWSWKQIAGELGIPYRTFIYYRHDTRLS